MRIAADGKCIVDYTQTSYPSHVRLGDILGAGEIMQTQCVESGPPPFGGQASNMGKASSAHIGVVGTCLEGSELIDSGPRSRGKFPRHRAVLPATSHKVSRSASGARAGIGSLRDHSQHHERHRRKGDFRTSRGYRGTRSSSTGVD